MQENEKKKTVDYTDDYPKFAPEMKAVSYTHLDVYKRQDKYFDRLRIGLKSLRI